MLPVTHAIGIFSSSHMPSIADLVRQFEEAVMAMPGRVAYADAGPRTRSRQLRVVESLAACVLQAPALRITTNADGQLAIRLPTPSGPGVLWTAEEMEAVHQDCCQGQVRELLRGVEKGCRKNFLLALPIRLWKGNVGWCGEKNDMAAAFFSAARDNAPAAHVHPEPEANAEDCALAHC